MDNDAVLVNVNVRGDATHIQDDKVLRANFFLEKRPRDREIVKWCQLSLFRGM